MPVVLREDVFRTLNELAHYGYVTTVRRIAQRF